MQAPRQPSQPGGHEVLSVRVPTRDAEAIRDLAARRETGVSPMLAAYLAPLVTLAVELELSAP